MLDDRIAGGPRVLVADDDPSCLAVYQLLLEQAGMSVDAARDGAEGIALLEARAAEGAHYDLLVLDIRMPFASGWDVMRRSRELTPLRGIPPRVLLMTGFSAELDLDRVKRDGASGILIKPISNQALVYETRRVLSFPAGQVPSPPFPYETPASQER